MSELLPSHLTESDVRELADECDTVVEFQLEARVRSRGRASRILNDLNLKHKFENPAERLARRS